MGLIGCSLKTYEDAASAPDLDTEFEEDIFCIVTVASNVLGSEQECLTYAHNSANAINTFCKQPLPSIISGGTANLICSGLGSPSGAGGAANFDFRFFRLSANVTARPWAKLIIGHMFVGVELPIDIDPNSFQWNLGLKTQRFFARDQGAKSSEGTLVRQASGEIRNILLNDIIGSDVTSLEFDATYPTYIPDALTTLPNLFDLVKINNSYPLLFNPYPNSFFIADPQSVNDVDGYNLTARQNYFSIYGFMEDDLQLLPGEYQDGLDSKYRARFRIQETR